MEYTDWRIDHDSPAYRGTLYLIRECFNNNGMEMGRERKLINVEEIPIYIKEKGEIND